MEGSSQHVYRQRTTERPTTSSATAAAPAARSEPVTSERTTMTGAPVATNPTADREGVRPHRIDHAAGCSCRDDIYDRIGTVLGPLAVRCRGWPVRAVRPLLARTWRDRFGSELNPAALDGTACALAAGRHWSEALWSGGR